MKKKYNFLWIILLSALCLAQRGLQAQNGCTDCPNEIKMVSDKQILLEKIDIPVGSQVSKLSTNVYVSYRSGDAQKFWANLAIATAGVVVSTQLHNANTGEGQNSTNRISPIVPLGVSVATLPSIWKNRPRNVPQAGLWIQHRDLRGNLLETWEQPISSEAKNSAELLTVTIIKPLSAGTLEIYLQNGSNNGVYYWGNETQKEIVEIEQTKELIKSPIAEIKTSLSLGCPMGFSTNGRGGCVDRTDPNLVVSYDNAEQIRGIKQNVLFENLLNPNVKKIVKDFKVSNIRGEVTEIQESFDQICYTYPVCETVVWWYCATDGYGNYWNCVFSHLENRCEGVTICHNTGGPTYDKNKDIAIKGTCDGVKQAWDNSFNPDGSVYKECNGFWLANGQILIYPQGLNTATNSNYAPFNGGISYYVGADGQPKVSYTDANGVSHTEVVQATFHTHPNVNNPSSSSPDENAYVNQSLNIPDIIISSDNQSYKLNYQNGQCTYGEQSNGKFSMFGCN